MLEEKNPPPLPPLLPPSSPPPPPLLLGLTADVDDENPAVGYPPAVFATDDE
jgi:hypothetical protein